jgi:anti-sigma regulatory factor (Ser/Thr protein kinase)
MSGGTGATGFLLPGGAAVPGGSSFRWHRVSVLEYAPLAEAVPSARGHARDVLREWGLAGVASDAEIALSELLTNAVTASAALPARPTVRVALLFDPGQLIIEVFDSAPAVPVLRVPGEDDPGGRGLLTVKALAHRWGWTPYRAGKLVWCDFWLQPPAVARRT